MNYSLLFSPADIHFLHWRQRLLLLSFLFCVPAVLMFTSNASAQPTNWLYVTTTSDGTKGYLSDEVKTLPNGNKNAWGKIIMMDGSFGISLTEWDCRNKRFLNRQFTYYNSDGSLAGTQKKSFEWSEIIPDSGAYFTYRRVCLPPQPVKWAQIALARVNLWSAPDESAPVLRIARQGERFQIIYEMAEEGWFNVVDATTQRDYWLPGNTFKIVETAETKQKTAKKEKAPQPPTTSKPKAKPRKNRRN
jgi:hypothetical protein